MLTVFLSVLLLKIIFSTAAVGLAIGLSVFFCVLFCVIIPIAICVLIYCCVAGPLHYAMASRPTTVNTVTTAPATGATVVTANTVVCYF